MSLTVTQRPSITYESETSRWNALKNPVVYKMQRKDYTFNQINNNGGNIQIQFTGTDITAQFSIGDSIRVKSDNGVYDGIGLVTANNYAGNTLITIDIPYVSTAPGGFVNNNTKRRNYRVEVEVYNGDDELLNEVAFYYSPNSLGELLIDVSKVIRAHVRPDITLDLTGSTEVFEDTNYTEFYIKYRERWTGSAESQTNDTANRFYAVLAGMQIPSSTGGNMGPYVIPEVEFLTKLDTIVIWRGYPALLSAIVNEDVPADVFLDTVDDTTTPADQSGKLIVFDLNQIITDQTVTEVTARIVESTSGGDAVSVTKDILLEDACENPVMLISRNSLGGIIQWLFDVNQEHSYEVDETSKVKKQRLFADNLTINQWEALQDFITPGEVYKDNIPELLSTTIKTSTRVGNQVYVLYPDGTKVGVVVTSKAKGTETRQLTHNFEIDIEYPEIFI